MTIIEMITDVDAMKPNGYEQIYKIQWLSHLDGRIKNGIIDTHEGGEVAFNGYGDSTDLHPQLLVPEPYAEMYLRWMEAQIDYYNGEYEKYNNAMDMFHTAYRGFASYYNRTHMPKGSKMKYFGPQESLAQYQSANAIAKVTIREVEE